MHASPLSGLRNLRVSHPFVEWVLLVCLWPKVCWAAVPALRRHMNDAKGVLVALHTIVFLGHLSWRETLRDFLALWPFSACA
jgi:hypothetical protein